MVRVLCNPSTRPLFGVSTHAPRRILQLERASIGLPGAIDIRQGDTMFAAGIQRIPCTLWQSLSDAGHVTLDLPVEFFPAKLDKSPVLWSRDEVQLWVEWCAHEFSLSNVNVTKFDMNGKALCLLAKGDFFDRVPLVGDVLYNTLGTLLHKTYNHISRGDDETLAERDYSRVRACRHLSGDNDDREWRERRRSSGHDCDVGDKKDGELGEGLHPSRGECGGVASHLTNGYIIPRSSVRAGEHVHLLLNGKRVTVDQVSARLRVGNTDELLSGETAPLALDLSQTSRPSKRSFLTEQRDREGIHRDDAHTERDASSSRQWIPNKQVCDGWMDRKRSPFHGSGIKGDRPANTQLSSCDGNEINDNRHSNFVGDTKVAERQDWRQCQPLSRSPSLPLTLPPLTKAELRPWTATPPRFFPEILAAYMTSPVCSVAVNGDVNSGISAGQMVSNEFSNHHAVGRHVTVGDVNVVDATGRSRDLQQQQQQQPQNNAYCNAVQEGIGCRTLVKAALRVPGSTTLPSNDILEQRDITEPLDANRRHTPDKKDGRLLWEFLSDMLVDGRQKDVIRWEDRQTRTFIIVDPAGLAAMWGKHKQRPHMTYEKMSRAMRYYYDMQIIRRVPGRRLTYNFMQEPSAIQRGVRGAKRGVPHARRRCTNERPIAPKVTSAATKLIPIAAKVLVNAGQDDAHNVHSSSNQHSPTCQNGENANETAGVSTENVAVLPRRDCVRNGDSHASYGEFEVDDVTRSTGIVDDGRSEMSIQPSDLERNGNQETDINRITANMTHTRSDIQKCETVACPDDDKVVDNRVCSDMCAPVSQVGKKRQRGSASCDRLQVKRNNSVPVSPEVL